MFSAKNTFKNIRKVSYKYFNLFKAFLSGIKQFFEELPFRLKQFSLPDFSKVTFESFKRKVVGLILQIRNTSKEDIKKNFVQFVKYISPTM